MYTAFANEKLLGVYDTFEEAAAAVKEARAKQGIIEKLAERGREKQRAELGLSLVELCSEVNTAAPRACGSRE